MELDFPVLFFHCPFLVFVAGIDYDLLSGVICYEMLCDLLAVFKEMDDCITVCIVEHMSSVLHGVSHMICWWGW